MAYSEVVNQDNMEFMSGVHNYAFDLVVDDPPYFSGPERRKYYGKQFSTNGIQRVDYPVSEHWTVPGSDYFKEVKRISKHQIIWGVNYYDHLFGPGRIVWDKCNGDSSFSDCEIAYCSFHDSVRLFRFMWNGMQQGKSINEGHIMQGNKKLNEERIHPCQKPVALYKWIIREYCERWNIKTVFSPHVGSGSDRIAFWDAGIDFYGCELDKKHHQRQEHRFLIHRKQQKLFL